MSSHARSKDRTTLRCLVCAFLFTSACGADAGTTRVDDTTPSGEVVAGDAHDRPDTKEPDDSTALDTNEPDTADTAEPDTADTAEPDAADTAEPDAADTAEADADDSFEPDIVDTFAPDAADTAEPDTADAAEPDTADAAELDAADTLAPDAADTLAPDAADTSAPDAADTFAPDVADTAEPEPDTTLAADTDDTADDDADADDADVIPCPPGGPTAELCNDADDDCDGLTDEDFIASFATGPKTRLAGALYAADNGKTKGASCGVGTCIAAGAGRVACAADHARLVCTSDALAAAEACDTLDNDCDGTRDEGFAWSGKPIGQGCDGTGACGIGTVQCADAATATCSTNPNGRASGARPEACDRTDNDCDGATDEDFGYQGLALGAACDGVGACGPGVVECAGAGAATCSTNPGASRSEVTQEVCDGDDDDCDGAVDNACVTPCNPESNAAFCARKNKNCGAVFGNDNCGAPRTADCGACRGTDMCGSVTRNVCGPCIPEDDGDFCDRLGAECGELSAPDNCLEARTAACGTCDGIEVCHARAENQCDCPAESDVDFCARLGRVCGAVTAPDNCGDTRTVASCGACPGFCDSSGACLGPCGDVTAAGCCDGSLLVTCTSDTIDAARCDSAATCGWSAAASTYACGFGGADPSGAAPRACDGLEHPAPACTPEDHATFCARLGRACGSHTALDNCGESRTVASCGTCAFGQCLAGGTCTECGNATVEQGEQCDDGARTDGDDCDATCHIVGLCADTCTTAHDGDCDDGGFGADDDGCAYGSDCADCTPRRDEPCREFPSGGTCADPDTLATCSGSGGGGALDLDACGAFAVCSGAPGEAACVVDQSLSCTPGDSVCDGATTRLVCNNGGRWSASTCAQGCVAFVGGSFCRATASQTVHGRVTYDLRRINGARTNWGALTNAPLPRVVVVALRWQSATQSYATFDATISDDDGDYTLDLPTAPAAQDRVGVWLVGLDEHLDVVYAVADPDFAATGEHEPFEIIFQGGTAAPWMFMTPAQTVAASPDLNITDAAGSGAAHVFSVLDSVYTRTREVFGAPGDRIAIWMQQDVTWSCGACASPLAASAGDYDFDSAIWIAMDDLDEPYWSDAVTAHELGHWVMSSFGTSPNEGGPHYIGVPTMPGQAWSEGFATFFSSLARAHELYYDKQGGGFFWVDLAAMSYSGGGEFVRPTADAEGYPDADDPLLQRMDENYVAGMCWAMATDLAAATPELSADGAFFMDALASYRMNITRDDPGERFPRGYVRHSWSLDGNGQITDLQSYPAESAPMVADYLDALRCLPADAGVADVDALVGDALGPYPYPIDDPPLCEPRPEAPLRATLTGPDGVAAGDVVTLVLELARPHPNATPITVDVIAPRGTRLVGTRAREVIVDARATRLVRTLRLHIARVPSDDLVVRVDARAASWGFHAEPVYRFGRPAPAIAKPPRDPFTRDALGRALGRPVRLR